jgi:hypothetical protein
MTFKYTDNYLNSNTINSNHDQYMKAGWDNYTKNQGS